MRTYSSTLCSLAWLSVVAACRRGAVAEHKPVIGADSTDARIDAATAVPDATIRRLVGVDWGACAITTSGHSWCFSNVRDPARWLEGWKNVQNLVGGTTGEDSFDDQGCTSITVCARFNEGSVRCKSNSRSGALSELLGPGTSLPPAVCGAPADDFSAERTQFIGRYVATEDVESCGSGPMALRFGLVVGLEREVVAMQTYRSGGDTCCGRYPIAGSCQLGPISNGCSFRVAYSDGSPSEWIDGLGHMSDGSYRAYPLGPADRWSAYDGAVAVVHAEDGSFKCAVGADRVLRCQNEPFDYCYSVGPRPAYRDWHVIEGMSNAMALAVDREAGGAVVCALREGAVWCWGSDFSSKSFPGGRRGLLGPTQPKDRCVSMISTNNQKPLPNETFCQRTPIAIPGLGDAVQLVTAGHHNMCVLTKAGEVRCWGAETAGAVVTVAPPKPAGWKAQ